jgi:hypothetical protein
MVGLAVPAPTRSGSTTRIFEPVVVATTLPQTTATGSTSATVTPEPVVVAVTLPQATGTAGTSTTTQPEPVLVGTTLPQHTWTGNANILPEPVTVSAFFPQTRGLGGNDQTVTVEPVTLTIVVPDAIRRIGYDAQPDSILIPVTVNQVGLSTGWTTSPQPVLVAVALPTTELLTVNWRRRVGTISASTRRTGTIDSDETIGTMKHSERVVTID